MLFFGECYNANEDSDVDALLNHVSLPAPILDKMAHFISEANKDTPKYTLKGLDVFFYGSTFILAGFSAAVYWYGALEAGERYLALIPGTEWLFKWVAPIATLITNTMFNWSTFIALWEEETDPYSAFKKFWPSSFMDGAKKIFAIISSAATIAPFFFIGFVGSLFQKGLVAISAALSLFVFYQGALSFYAAFHYPFIQNFRWSLRGYDARKLKLVAQKADVMNHLKQLEEWFYTASSDERQQFMKDFFKLQSEADALHFLLSHKRFPQNSSVFSWVLFLIFSGMGIPGILVLAQNFGHVIGLVQGVFALQLPLVCALIISTILVIGNLVPGLGFSFSGMLNFNFIDLMFKLTFCHQSQTQRILMGKFLSLPWVSLFLTFTLLRLSYMLSGWSNDQVNYLGMKTCVGNEAFSFVFGVLCNVAGAFIFNGVQCEILIRDLMEKLVESCGSAADKKQVVFQRTLSSFVKEVETQPTNEFDMTVNHSDTKGTFAKFFTLAGSQLTSTTPLLQRECSI